MADFIKKNLFFVILIGLVVVCCGGALGYRMVTTGKTRAVLDERAKVFLAIRGFGETCANGDMLKNQTLFVTTAKNGWAELDGKANEISLGSHKPLRVNVGDSVVDLFPLTDEKYSRVFLHFSDSYNAAMKDLLVRLTGREDGVVPPTLEEISLEAQREFNAMELAIRPKSSGNEEAVYLPPGIQPPRKPVVIDELGDGEIDPGGAFPVRPVLPPVTATTPEEEPEDVRIDEADARAKAIENLKALKVRDEKFYVTAKSMALHPLVDRPGRSEIWKAWLNLLLHERVITSILATNNAAAGPDAKDWKIRDAAIKRMVKMTIGLPGASEGKTRLYHREGEDPYSSHGSTRSGFAVSSGSGSAATALSFADSLTQRTCSRDYDVVNFDLTIVMRSAELNRFIYVLQKGDFLTVVKYRIGEPGAALPVATGMPEAPPDMANVAGPPTGASNSEEEMYYYGPDPVIQVTLTLEALFFAQWRSEKLMPSKMLSLLPYDALREEDIARLRKAGDTAP